MVLNLFLSLPRVINFEFSLQPHQKYNITQYKERSFSYLNQIKDDYTTNFHYSTYTFHFEGSENALFELGSERVNTVTIQEDSNDEDSYSEVTL